MLTLNTNEIQTDSCTCCRACEVACSFHFIDSFSPTHSAIRVARDNSAGEVTITLRPTCDLCRGEEEPLCVSFCSPGVITRDLLKDVSVLSDGGDNVRKVSS